MPPPNPLPAATSAAQTYFRITLMRSPIGMPKKVDGALRSLGLQKRMRTVYHPVRQDIAGMIFRVKELVDVKEVDKSDVMTAEEMRKNRRPESGFYVERRAADIKREVQGLGEVD